MQHFLSHSKIFSCSTHTYGIKETHFSLALMCRAILLSLYAPSIERQICSAQVVIQNRCDQSYSIFAEMLTSFSWGRVLAPFISVKLKEGILDPS